MKYGRLWGLGFVLLWLYVPLLAGYGINLHIFFKLFCGTAALQSLWRIWMKLTKKLQQTHQYAASLDGHFGNTLKTVRRMRMDVVIRLPYSRWLNIKALFSLIPGNGTRTARWLLLSLLSFWPHFGHWLHRNLSITRNALFETIDQISWHRVGSNYPIQNDTNALISNSKLTFRGLPPLWCRLTALESTYAHF